MTLVKADNVRGSCASLGRQGGLGVTVHKLASGVEAEIFRILVCVMPWQCSCWRSRYKRERERFHFGQAWLPIAKTLLAARTCPTS